jgi:hypothetical protein
LAGIETNFVGGKESKGMFEGMFFGVVEVSSVVQWRGGERERYPGERKVWNSVQILESVVFFVRSGFCGIFRKYFFRGILAKFGEQYL